MMRLSIGMKLALGSACGFVILVIVGAVAYVNTRELMDGRQWVSHTLEVLTTASGLRADIAGAVAGVRGYLLYGDETYLEPYQSASAAVSRDIDRLRQLTVDNPREQARIQALGPLTSTLLERFAERIAIQKQQGSHAAVGSTEPGAVKQTMDAIQPLVTAITDEESGLLVQRDAEAQRTAQITFRHHHLLVRSWARCCCRSPAFSSLAASPRRSATP